MLIASIEDGTTLLFYTLAPNEMLANAELMEKEFWSLAETEGIADIEELNRILDRAVNLKNFLKGDDRVDRIACYVAGTLPAERGAAGLQSLSGGCRSSRLRQVQSGTR